MKKEVMTQYLVNHIIDQMAVFLIEDEDLTIDEALHIIYESKAYENLQDIETGLQCYSPSYVYELLKRERALAM